MAYPQYGGDPYGYGQFGAPPVQRRNGMGLAAMTLGILSVPLVLIPFLGIVLGILAVVFGILGMKRAARSQATNKGQALTGVICGAVGVVGAVIFFAWAYDTAKSCIDKYDIDTPAYNQCIRDKVNGTG
jgi:hypothetical protein